MANHLAEKLQSKIGKHNAVTAKYISDYLLLKYRKKVHGSRVRKIINYIRINHLVNNLVSSSKGYYIERDYRKVLEYAKSLKQRSDAILKVAESLVQYPQQLKLMD